LSPSPGKGGGIIWKRGFASLELSLLRVNNVGVPKRG